MNFKKGDVVAVKATVSTQYCDGMHRSPGYLQMMNSTLVHVPPYDREVLKCLIKRPLRRPQKGMVMGYTARATGHYVGRVDEDDISYLIEDKRHKVIVVEPLRSQRWAPPWICLEEDLVLIEEAI